MKIIVKIKMLEGCSDLAPRKAHHDDAAYDLRARIDVELPCAASTLVPTGLFIELPVGYEAQVRPRSGLALQHSLTLTSIREMVDFGDRGEVVVVVFVVVDGPFIIHLADRIDQVAISRRPDVELVEGDHLSDTVRGGGGFGTTGKE